jgi:hypothetical protein
VVSYLIALHGQFFLWHAASITLLTVYVYVRWLVKTVVLVYMIRREIRGREPFLGAGFGAEGK